MWGCPVQGQELESIIFVGPSQLGTFHDSMILVTSVIEGSERLGSNGAVRVCSAVISCAFIQVKACKVGIWVCGKHLAYESPTALKKCKVKDKALMW